MANNSQLARIVAPNINETNYAGKMQEAFDNINENFKKIASLPFLQGVKGDSYEIVEHEIWNEFWHLTSYGALLLNGIFGTHFSEDDKYSECKSDIPTLNGVSPLKFFGEPGENPKNNILYFYSIIDDAGHETQQQLGQYYYFIDARLTEIGKAYDNKDEKLINFVDYSGFYYYIPTHIEEGVTINEHYEKTALLPAIYYDAVKNDICWEFKGVRTGISAIGVAGADGKPANLEYVKVIVPNDHQTFSGDINAIFKYNTPNTSTDHWSKDQADLATLKDGDNVLICMFYNGHTVNFAFGQVSRSNGLKAVWNEDMQLNTIITDEFITEYFNNVGRTGMAADPRYFGIPMYIDRDSSSATNKTKAHVITTSDYLGSNYKDTTDLIFRHMKNIFNGGTPEREGYRRDVVFDNYNIKVVETPYNSSTQKDTYPNNVSYTKISNGRIECFSGGIGFSPTIINGAGISAVTGSFKEEAKAKVNGVNDVYLGCPIGTVVMWVGNRAPDGWLLCDGKTINPDPDARYASYKGPEYEALYNLIGTTYGTLSGSRRLPNFQQKFPLGATGGTMSTYPTSLGSIGGEATHKLTVSEMPEHDHVFVYSVGGDDSESSLRAYGSKGVITDEHYVRTTTTGVKGNDRYHNNIPPFLAINFIIKYK